MTLMEWLNMNMAVDIVCLVFFCAIVWKFRKLEKQIAEARQDIKIISRNPSGARRLLKEKYKE